jgi:phosphoglycerate dehydrogenase-like enzyme
MAGTDKHIQAAFFTDSPNVVAEVYGVGKREELEGLTDCYPTIVGSENFDEHAPNLAGLEVIFTTWGMPELTPGQLDRLPNLKIVFYGAGSVQGFCRPLFERGITVVSAWAANAVPVAEFTLAQILLANKGYFRNVREYRKGPERFDEAFRGRGNFAETVALLGAGKIGRYVIHLLKPFKLHVTIFDPFLSEADAEKLGVTKVSMEEAFAESTIVSNHLANLPATVGMLDRKCFESMRENATFINTGRGATVAEEDLLDVLKQRRDLTAMLDVTTEEPAASESPLFTLPNVFVSTHIAGSMGGEVVRMADYIIEEFLAWQKGEPMRYVVTPAMIERMA